jgi:hypothetical protein
MRHVVRVVLAGLTLCVAGAAAAAHMAATVAANPGRMPKSIAFMGGRYVLSRSVHKGIGVDTLYLPSGSRHGNARDTLMINYTLSHGAHHSPVTARQIAARMAGTFRALHAPLPPPVVR